MNSRQDKITVTLGFSPCPNDTFMFDALVNNRIDTEGIHFEFVMEDVETLNRKAFNAELDITKLSFYAFSHLTDSYSLLNSGSALGRGCGPLVIAKDPNQDLSKARIGIPGKYTTAHFLFNLFSPQSSNKAEMLFSEIEDAILKSTIDAGVIIHENRFTYAEKGLQKIVDLGDFWEKQTNLPIPLGGIVIKRNLPLALKLQIDRLLKKSIEYAFENPAESLSFCKANAQEMDEKVMQSHIALYVNEFSLNLGPQGKAAIDHLFEKARTLNLLPEINENIYTS